MANIVCVIPARGGSKRVPNKNMRDLAGDPLVEYTLSAALTSGIFEEIIVSSGDEEILDFAERDGITTDVRPESLRGDTVRTVEIIGELLNRRTVRERFDTVAQMLPTCPFRTPKDVQNAREVYIQNDQELPVVSLTEYDFSPIHALEFDTETNSVTVREPKAYDETTRTQDIPDFYHPNGAIYLSPITRFLEDGEFFVEPLLGSFMPPERSIDIDLPYEFRMADLYMSHLKESGER